MTSSSPPGRPTTLCLRSPVRVFTDSDATICHPLDLELELNTCSGPSVAVEFLAGDGTWQLIPGAKAVIVFPNSYQVTLSLAPAWAQHAALLEAMTFRVEGRICSSAFVESAERSGSLTMMMLVQ